MGLFDFHLAYPSLPLKFAHVMLSEGCLRTLRFTLPMIQNPSRPKRARAIPSELKSASLRNVFCAPGNLNGRFLVSCDYGL